MRRPTCALLAVAVIVVAGCSAPVADAPGPATNVEGTPDDASTASPGDDPGTTTPPEDETDGGTNGADSGDGSDEDGSDDGRPTENGSRAIVRTLGFDPAYNATLVLQRVEALRGLDATGAIYVHQFPASRSNVSAQDYPDRWGTIGRVGARLLQLYTTERARPIFVSTPGYTILRGGDVHVYLLNASALDRRFGWTQSVVLAHELVHALQFQHGLFDRTALVDAETTDERLAVLAGLEGDAVYVTERYVRRYRPNATISPAFYNRTPKALWARWLPNAAYTQGYRYYRRIDAVPADRSDFIAAGPVTTGALFPGWPGELGAIPRPFRNESLTLIRQDRFGPLVVRYALRANGVEFTEAQEAVVGWRNGSVYYYSASDGLPVAWVTTWANASEAAEFVGTWRDVLTRGNATRRGDVLVVHGTNVTPTTRYVLRRDGDTVYVFYAANGDPLRRLAAGWGARTGRNGTSKPPRSTDALTTREEGAAPARPLGVRHGIVGLLPSARPTNLTADARHRVLFAEATDRVS